MRSSCIFYPDAWSLVSAERTDGQVRISIQSGDLMFRLSEKQALNLAMQLTAIINEIDKENKIALDQRPST